MYKNAVRLLDSEGTNSPLYRQLEQVGFFSLEVSSDPVHALQCLESVPAHVVITREHFAEMDGVGFAKTVREIDKESRHFTYIILITDSGAVCKKTSQFADSVFSSEESAKLLKPTVETACRLSERINRLERDNAVLQKRCMDFQDSEMIDALTGLGNERYLEKSLDDNITQIESRGGVVCVIYIGIANFSALLDKHHEIIVNDLVVQVGMRIRTSVRPLDVVTYIGDGMFVLVLNQPSLDDCVPESYIRIFDGVRLKSYQTKAGFVMVRIGMGFCASGAETGPPKQDYLRGNAKRCMLESIETESICYERFEL